MPAFTRQRRTAGPARAGSASSPRSSAASTARPSTSRRVPRSASPVEASQPAAGHPVLADGLALNIARQLRECSEGDRWAFVHAMRGHVLEARPERVVLCLNAMTVCRQDARRISKGLYEEWQARQTNPREWPSSQFISDTFGSWKRATAAFGAEAIIDVLVSDLTTTTHAFTEAEVVANLREYGESQGLLTFDSYRNWAHEQMLEPGRRQPRYIRSMRRINELFGTWWLALASAGLVELAPAGPQTRVARRRGTVDDYRPDRCCGWLRAAALLCGDSKMTKKRYNEWARGHELKEAQAGRHTVVPRSDAVSDAFGGWAAALHAAGLIDDRELSQRAGHRTAFVPDEDLIAAVARVVVMEGLHTSLHAYDLHRARVRREQNINLPSSGLVRKRLGGWGRAVALAAERLCADGVALPQQTAIAPHACPRSGRALTAAEGQR